MGGGVRTHLQVVHGCLHAPAVVLQGRLTLLQGDPMNRLLHLHTTAALAPAPFEHYFLWQGAAPLHRVIGPG